MKRRDLLKSAPLAAAAATLSCSGANENPVGEAAAVDTTETESGIAVAKTAGITPLYDKFGVILQDGDGWLLELNHINTRYGVKIYKGHLRFMYGSVSYTGNASGTFYPTLNAFNVVCNEDYFSTDEILMYHFAMTANTNNLVGMYSYHMHRYKSSPISGKLLHGSIGGYEAKKSTAKIAVPVNSTTVNPKGWPIEG